MTFAAPFHPSTLSRIPQVTTVGYMLYKEIKLPVSPTLQKMYKVLPLILSERFFPGL